MKKNKVLGGLMGLCVGDALGVPFETFSRSEMKKKPATGMAAYGPHLQPAGTWSDDSSLAFCLADSLCSGFDINDIAEKFVRWFEEGLWTPYGFAFGIGNTTLDSVIRLKYGISPSESGGFYKSQNGNGSLMRILPLAYYVENLPVDKQFEITHEVSAITHAHPRSKMACGIYVQIAVELLRGKDPGKAYENAKITVREYYSRSPFSEELKHFSRVLDSDISELPEEEIHSSGYVVDTLEASIWCLLNNTSYRETALAAVNLGEDTDTTGAVAGGLAGIYYGFESIPSEWVDTIARKDDIIALASRLSKKIYGE
jgi:ADP-ribosyl-[dinitrogen reductase] hydrolase